MIGMVIVTHGNFSEALLKTAEMIIGPQEKVAAVALNASEGLEDLKAKIQVAVEKVMCDKGVIIFTDMFGGSPSNVSVGFLSDKVEVITGVNLPVLLESAMLRESAETLHKFAKEMLDKTKKTMVIMSEIHKTCR